MKLYVAPPGNQTAKGERNLDLYQQDKPIYSTYYHLTLTHGAHRRKVPKAMKTATIVIAGLMLLMSWLLWPDTGKAATETAHIPITIDYALLRSLVSFISFKQPGNRAVASGQDNACNRFELWQPELGPDAGRVKLGTHLKMQIGIPLGNDCVKLTDWEGFIEVLQRVSLDDKSWRLMFQTQDVRILNKDRENTPVDKTISHLIRMSVCPFLDKISIDLSTLVTALRNALPLFFSDRDRPGLERSLEHLRAGQVQVGQHAVTIDLLADVESVIPSRKDLPSSPPMEIQDLTARWENWDTFLIHQFSSLMNQPISESETDTLLETLLTSRYGLVQALKDKSFYPQIWCQASFLQAGDSSAPSSKSTCTADPPDRS
jgi:hypothetical protein